MAEYAQLKGMTRQNSENMDRERAEAEVKRAEYEMLPPERELPD